MIQAAKKLIRIEKIGTSRLHAAEARVLSLHLKVMVTVSAKQENGKQLIEIVRAIVVIAMVEAVLR